MPLCATPRAPWLALAPLYGHDSLRAQTRDAARNEAFHDHCVREPVHLGVGDRERSEEGEAGFLFFLPLDSRSFQWE